MRTIVRAVYLLDGGSLELDSSVLCAAPGGERATVPVSWFLLETDEGPLLVDTGNDPAVIDDPVRWGGRPGSGLLPLMTPDHHPARQLARLGLGPGDIRVVIYTHLHRDHAGAARLFPAARHVVQAAEYRWARHPDGFSRGSYPVDGPASLPLDWELVDGDRCLFPGIHLLTTPGHSPGHQSVVLWAVPAAGSVIITGDAVPCLRNIEADRPPGVATDVPAAMSSLHRLTALAEATGAQLLVSHDAGAAEGLARAPDRLTRGSEPIGSRR